MKRHFNIPIFIPHLGCPFDCIFCNQKKIASTIRPPHLTEICETIEKHTRTMPPNSTIEVAFFGGSFTAIDKAEQVKYLEVIQPYLVEGRVESIRISTRPDFIDETILELLSQYGVKTIELGVQSLDDGVLKKSSRGYTVAEVYRAAHLIKQHGFKLGIQLMVGLPGDNYNLDIKSTEKAIALEPDFVRIYPTIVIAETYLASLYKKDAYKPLELADAVTITKEMYLRFTAANIKVIRMGLYPSEELISGDAILAGPFHPAFGELVEQEIFYDQAKKLIAALEGDFDKITIYINPRDISKMIGNKRRNIVRLKNTLKLEKVLVKAMDSLELNNIGINTSDDGPQYIISRAEYIRKK